MGEIAHPAEARHLESGFKKGQLPGKIWRASAYSIVVL
jgi:hypothetical protein